MKIRNDGSIRNKILSLLRPISNQNEKKKTVFKSCWGGSGGVFGPTNDPKKYYSRELTTFPKKKNRRIKFRIEGSIRNKKTSRIRAKLN